MLNPLDLLGPWKYAVYIGVAAALIGGATYEMHRYNDSLREEGRQEIRAQDREAMQKQADANLELQRAAEKRYVVQAETRDHYIVQTVKEIHEAAAPLAVCPVPADAIRMLHDAAECARSDSPGACGDDGKVRDAR